MKTILYLNNRYCASKEDLQQVLGESKNQKEKSFRNEVLATFKDHVMQKWCEERGLFFGLDKIDISESDDAIFKAIVVAVTGHQVTADFLSKFNDVGELVRVECNGNTFEDVADITIHDKDAKTISFVFRSKKPENNIFKFSFNGVTKNVNWNDMTTNKETSIEFPAAGKGKFPLKEGAGNEFCSVYFASDISVEVGGVKFLMKYVEGGTFQMGSNEGCDNEKPVHTVTLSPYYIGETQVTQGLWNAVMPKGSNPSNFKYGDNYPVENVSWYDCQNFIRQLNEKTKMSFRLPSEAEWEYAARGGKKSKGCKFSGDDNIDNVAWYADNSGSSTNIVGQKKANALGIYDMSGNVWEWCQDWYDKDYYQKCKNNTELCNNPQGPSSGVWRVVRGGSWRGSAGYCRVSYRGGTAPGGSCDYFGFRLLLSSPKKEKEEK